MSVIIDDRWIRELRKTLPDSGEATLIVTDAEGARYLRISSADIDTFQRRSSSVRRILAVVISGLCVGLVSLFKISSGTEVELQAHIQNLQGGLESIAQSLSGFENDLPQSVANHSGLSSDELTDRVLALKDIIHFQDETFSFFVEATRPVIEGFSEDIAENLRGAGVEWHVDETGPGAVALGGSGLQGEFTNYLSYHLSDTIADVLTGYSQINEVLGELPLAHPLDHARITSRFGVRRHPITRRMEPHQGVDFVSYTHPEVKVTAAGTVSFAGRDGLYGNKVTVSHENGIDTVYAHLKSIAVDEGDVVQAGDLLGIMGNTGRSTASHLHYEVHVNGKRVDPLSLIGIGQNVLQ